MRSRQAVLATLVALLSLALFVASASAAIIQIDQDAGIAGGIQANAGQVVSTVFSNLVSYSTTHHIVGNDYRYNTSSGTATATYTPSLVGSFTPGKYEVYATWGVYPSHEGQAKYTVNYVGGSAVFQVSQQVDAAQYEAASGPGPLPAWTGGDGRGSGYYYLGEFNLDAASTVVLSRVNTTSTAPFTVDALRLESPSEGLLIDKQSAKVIVSNVSQWSISPANTTDNYTNLSPGDPVWGFGYTDVDNASLTYTPGFAGPRHVFLSWAAQSAHDSAAVYTIDLDGVAGGTDQTVLVIDQRKLANGNTATGTNWSGWYDAGIYKLTAASTITLTPGSGTGRTTVDALRLSEVVPEPNSLVLLAAGGMPLLLSLRRHRKPSPDRRSARGKTVADRKASTPMNGRP